MRFHRRLLASTMAIGMAWPALAADSAKAPPAPPPAPRYAMPATQMFDMESDKGERYRIFVSYPETGEVPKNGYPVLYVLDGNASFASFAETRRLLEYADMGKSIIVGVGYPGDKAYDNRRLNDLTPKLIDPAPPSWAELAKFKSGGRDAFLDFLTGKLRTEIGKRFRINLERQSLFGHSLGGLFALHALYSRPTAFYSIVAASPSLDWNDQSAYRDERVFAEKLSSGKIGKTSRLMIVVSGRDTDDDPYLGEELARRLDRLSGYGLRTRLRRYEEEVHITVPARAVTDVLRYVSEGY